MPRISNFTESEDRIILRHAHQPADAVNAALVAAGFVERSAEQLSQRRYYLRRRRPVAKVARSGGNAIIALEAERHEVMREIIAIDKQRAKLERRLREVTDALLDQVGRVESDVARLRRDPATPLEGRRHPSGAIESAGTEQAEENTAQAQGAADARTA
jgi:hypothetical protein